MTLVIVSILIIGYVLISTGWMTNVNRAAVAVFMGTVGWVLYICYGTDFVLAQHPREYSDFLMGVEPNPENVKHFISQNIFYTDSRFQTVLLKGVFAYEPHSDRHCPHLRKQRQTDRCCPE